MLIGVFLFADAYLLWEWLVAPEGKRGKAGCGFALWTAFLLFMGVKIFYIDRWR